jgi:NNP family nitrate/nitrite transporter-like MFS transporter
MSDSSKAIRVLILNTLAFTVCFAAWMMNGVLATFLVDNGLEQWDRVELGWLIGIPVLTGSVMRLPLGVLTDKYGGRTVYTLLMLCSAVPMWLLSYASGYREFLWCSLGFGLSGASFAVGIAYTSVWFPKERQGTALGIFGAGNAGSAVTSMCAPSLLKWLTSEGANLEGWRNLPRIYAGFLALTAIVFFVFTHEKKVEEAQGKTLRQRLAPLNNVRVWRFGVYYFFVFGGFVALAQWLIPYYVSVYEMSLVTAGVMATIFSLPSGVVRAAGGWLSDRFGARAVMYWVLGVSVLCCALLIVPRMDIQAPGQGVIAAGPSRVTDVSNDSIVVGDKTLALRQRPTDSVNLMNDPTALILPKFEFWQEPVVRAGDTVKRKQLLARGVTHIYFQANVWIFTGLVFLLGIAMGIGKAAVYKHIPDYFPTEVGVVGGIVGVIGGLGGFVCPIIFGYMLEHTGIWTTTWIFFFVVALVCLAWMHVVVRRMMRARVPELLSDIEHASVHASAPAAATHKRDDAHSQSARTKVGDRA